MHKRLMMAAILVVAAGTGSSAWAGWGCAYDSSAGIGRTWGGDTEEQVRTQAMHNCTVRNFKNCRIIGCSANVDSKEDADRLWARTPGVKYEMCDGPGQPRCK